MEMVILGSAGWVPQADRMTTCVAVRSGDALLLLDAGTGVARLREPRFSRLLPREGSVDILLSHLHLDHTAGLTFLPALWHGLPTTIHVPSGESTGFGLDVFDRLVGPPFFPHGFAAFPMPIVVTSIAPGAASVGGLSLEVRAQIHPGGSLGFRLGDRLAFMTDTAYDPAAAEFAAGVDVLVHEAWCKGQGDPEELQRGLAGHTSAEDAARVARDAGAGELLLSHLTPLRDEVYYAEMLARARGIFPHTHLCADGLGRTWDS